ncbi:TPA: hypothetical protein QDB26_005337 [Burkholderia vietnamiensis]|nr:hypothetical protein [Burkholderia vietnamiensis]HDR9216547.1 hypothetical protein [Burkholderia vietnamiensis]
MKNVRAEVLPFAHFLGLPKVVPAVTKRAKRIAAIRLVEAVARVTKAAIPQRAVQKTLQPPNFLSESLHQVSAGAPSTSIREERTGERARCKRIMDSAIREGNPQVGLELMKTNMSADDAVQLIQLLNLDTTSLCEHWSKGQVIGAKE